MDVTEHFERQRTQAIGGRLTKLFYMVESPLGGNKVTVGLLHCENTEVITLPGLKFLRLSDGFPVFQRL